MKDTQPAHRNAHPDCQLLVVGAWPPGTLHPGRGRPAKGNGPLVQPAEAIAANLDLPAASAADAEADLKLSPGH